MFEHFLGKSCGGSVILRRQVSLASFMQTIETAMRAYREGSSRRLHDFEIARRIKDRQQSVCILLGGTSGCGKSTLASLLASRFVALLLSMILPQPCCSFLFMCRIGLSTTVSTDNIRQLLRNVLPRDKTPELWSSSYYVGETLTLADGEQLTLEERVLRGFNKQNAILVEHIASLIESFERRHDSLIIEGVHLSVDVMLQLMRRFKSCIPFIVYISNESKHIERFAIRAKYMTLDTRENKYAKYFGNIRIIQDSLCTQADEHLVRPRISFALLYLCC